MTDNKINRCKHYYIVYATPEGSKVKCGICQKPLVMKYIYKYKDRLFGAKRPKDRKTKGEI